MFFLSLQACLMALLIFLCHVFSSFFLTSCFNIFAFVARMHSGIDMVEAAERV